MKGIRLTVRRGPRVAREKFDDLDQAVAALERVADDVRRDGRLPQIKSLRDFEPGDRVAARLEVSTGGMLGGRTAGIDVMGDGRLVAYGGGVTRQPLEPRDGESHFEAVKRVLEA